MDGNRDEAERCIEIAVNALREAKLDKAEKFLKKAENLYPTQKAKGECNTTVVYPINKNVRACLTERRLVGRSLFSFCFYAFFMHSHAILVLT